MAETDKNIHQKKKSWVLGDPVVKALFLKNPLDNVLKPFQITVIYLVVGGLWILLSDFFIQKIFQDIETLSMIQTVKGWLYILLSGGLIYLLVAKGHQKSEYWSRKLLESYEELEAVHEELLATEEDLKEKFLALQKSEEALRTSEERYRLALEGTSDGIWDHDMAGGEESFIFTRTKMMLGYEDEEIENTLDGLKSITHPDDVDAIAVAMAEYVKKRTPIYEIKYRLRGKSGEYRWIRSRGKATWDPEGRPLRMVGSHKDITDQKKAEEEIYRLAYYDNLTELPNRVVFEESLSKALKEADEKKKEVALIYLDLDNFKTVNDTLGHVFGDLLLKNVGNLLKRCIDDKGVVTRLGGDEFAILLPNIENQENVLPMVEKVLHSFQNPWILDDREFYITTSIGITFYPKDGQDGNTLFKNADTAMYSAKEHGKNNYRFYMPQMNVKMIEKLEMSNNLRKALERNELSLYYQPQIDLRSGKVVGVEALIRWIHPQWGMISPAKFIPIAEETGLILPIGEWVLRTACRQNKEWQDKGYPPVFVGVNLSARQFQQSDLVEMIHEIIKEYDLEPHWLELEITESLAMKDLNHTIEVLHKLRSLGIKIALDDFGTGYSSLNYLKKLPIDTLKIDKSFTDDITRDSSEEAIAKSLIALAHSMNLIVTAEGIETDEQRTFLVSQSCNKAQGYLFSKPVPSSEMEKLLSAV